MDSIAILDFGSQYSQLIARRVREAHVYCQLFPHDAPADAGAGHQADAALSSPAGPARSTTPARRSCRTTCWTPAGPCWASATACSSWPTPWAASGRLRPARVRPGAEVQPQSTSRPCVRSASGFELPASNFQAWMSHGDKVDRAAARLQPAAASDNCAIAAMVDPQPRAVRHPVPPRSRTTPSTAATCCAASWPSTGAAARAGRPARSSRTRWRAVRAQVGDARAWSRPSAAASIRRWRRPWSTARSATS